LGLASIARAVASALREEDQTHPRPRRIRPAPPAKQDNLELLGVKARENCLNISSQSAPDRAAIQDAHSGLPHELDLVLG
jgi:hypothetical protein